MIIAMFTETLKNYYSSTHLIFESQITLFGTLDKSFDLCSTDQRESPTGINLWLETDIFQLRKHYAVV
jgi:hypothetical protein